MGNAAEAVAEALAEDVFGHTTNPDQQLASLGYRVFRGTQYVAELEAKLKEAKAKLRDLQEQKLPEAMLSAGIRQFTVPAQMGDGIVCTIELKPIVSAKIPKHQRQEAISYLRDSGYGDELIKVTVTTIFKKGEHTEAMHFYKDLQADGFTVEMVETIHGGTLKAWAKKTVPTGIRLDLDLLGVYVGNRAEVVGQEQKEETEEE